MTLEIIPQSHLDHNLVQEHVSFILERFAARSGFFRETITLPFWLGPLMCGLHGPIVGDAPQARDARSRSDGESSYFRGMTAQTHPLLGADVE